MNTIKLEYNKGFQWHTNMNTYVKGYLFDKEGTFYRDADLLNYFAHVTDSDQFRKKVSVSNGAFSVLIDLSGQLLLAVDPIRSIPLFYSRSGDSWIISDTASELLNGLSIAGINELAEKEFKATGYVTGNETLIKGLHQVQAGEIVVLGESIEKSFYYSYRVQDTNSLSYAELKKEGIAVFETIFSRLIASLRGRTAVLPLSGGFDSRIIAVMLKKLNYKKVICFTYGRRNNKEALISKKVAETLGFPWYFVEYSEECIAGFVDSAEFRNYFPRAANLSSMFYLQEYFAIKYLNDNKLIPEDAVFIPGHSGDFIGGSQFAKHNFSAEKEDVSDIVERIFRVKYHYFNYNRTDALKIKERICSSLLEKSMVKKENNEDLAYSIHEDWDFKEKFAKFNVNSNATYSYFGYEFRIPFWDLDILRFFRNLPVKVKINKLLYDDILTHEYFARYNLNLETELQPDLKYYSRARIKKRIKRLIPPFIVRKLVKKKDLLCYFEITSKLRQDMLKKGKKPGKQGNRYNKMIIEWYLNELKLQLKEE